MKRAVTGTAVALTIMCLYAGFCAAHPPSAIRLTYEPDSNILNVTVEHSVNDVKKHYIRTVIVKINERMAITQNLTLQPEEDMLPLTYSIYDVKTGDTLNISATCNVSGSLNKSIKVEKLEETEFQPTMDNEEDIDAE